MMHFYYANEWTCLYFYNLEYAVRCNTISCITLPVSVTNENFNHEIHIDFNLDQSFVHTEHSMSECKFWAGTKSRQDLRATRESQPQVQRSMNV